MLFPWGVSGVCRDVSLLAAFKPRSPASRSHEAKKTVRRRAFRSTSPDISDSTPCTPWVLCSPLFSPRSPQKAQMLGALWLRAFCCKRGCRGGRLACSWDVAKIEMVPLMDLKTNVEGNNTKLYIFGFNWCFSASFAMVPSSGRLPPPHGMVQVGVQGQGRGMPLQPHH